jgi:hypothetical protein
LRNTNADGDVLLLDAVVLLDCIAEHPLAPLLLPPMPLLLLVKALLHAIVALGVMLLGIDPIELGCSDLWPSAAHRLRIATQPTSRIGLADTNVVITGARHSQLAVVVLWGVVVLGASRATTCNRAVLAGVAVADVVDLAVAEVVVVWLGVMVVVAVVVVVVVESRVTIDIDCDRR